MGSRRRARESTLQFLYQFDTTTQSGTQTGDLDDALELFRSIDEGVSDPETAEFSETLIRGTCDNMGSIDGMINECSEHWKLERMPKIDRNILRMAVYELAYLGTVPPAVTINEAVELAKKFGSEESGAFVNGILDKIRSDVEEGKTR